MTGWTVAGPARQAEQSRRLAVGRLGTGTVFRVDEPIQLAPNVKWTLILLPSCNVPVNQPSPFFKATPQSMYPPLIAPS